MKGTVKRFHMEVLSRKESFINMVGSTPKVSIQLFLNFGIFQSICKRKFHRTSKLTDKVNKRYHVIVQRKKPVSTAEQPNT